MGVLGWIRTESFLPNKNIGEDFLMEPISKMFAGIVGDGSRLLNPTSELVNIDLHFLGLENDQGVHNIVKGYKMYAENHLKKLESLEEQEAFKKEMLDAIKSLTENQEKQFKENWIAIDEAEKRLNAFLKIFQANPLILNDNNPSLRNSYYWTIENEYGNKNTFYYDLKTISDFIQDAKKQGAKKIAFTVM